MAVLTCDAFTTAGFPSDMITQLGAAAAALETVHAAFHVGTDAGSCRGGEAGGVALI